MNNSQSQSDNDQGFFVPQVKYNQPIIQKNQFSLNQILQQQNINTANDLVYCQRPVDFIPRLIIKGDSYKQYPQQLNVNFQSILYQQQLQQMIPINNQNIIRQKRYSSLKAKYQNNKDFQCVYSKISNNQEFDGYIFSLQNTTDYNPDDYKSPQPQIQNNNNLQSDQFVQSSQDKNNNRFNSNFQSGNLLYAFQIKNSMLKQYHNKPQIIEYDLIMQNDTNTKGYNQWFYFSYKNKKCKKVRFNIVNFIKKKLLFLDGVRPVGYSIKQSKKYAQQQVQNINEKGWKTIGSNIHYKKSYITRQIQGIKGSPTTYKNYYTLSFDVEFTYENDTFYIAMNYPYTYSGMIKFVNRVVNQSPSNLQITKNIICHTISNNPMPYLKIKAKHDFKQKGKILCLGRQHPGESVGSFVLQNFVDQIIQKWKNQQKKEEKRYKVQIQNSEQESKIKPIQKLAQQKKKQKNKNKKQDKDKKMSQLQLLKNYQLIVIPMVNPDGVIYGNFRTSLSGFDLNRQWISPNRWLQPQIFFLQKFLSSLDNVAFCMDFHGHSKKLNTFIYACVDQAVTDFRMYPWIYNDLCPLFSIKDCTYSITPDKFRTARVNIYNQIKKPFIYTLQTSFFGYSQNGKNYRFKLKDFRQIGKDAAKALQILFVDSKKVKIYEQEIKDKSYLFDQWAFFNKQDMGSQSNPSQDQLNAVERQKKVMSQKTSSNNFNSKKLSKGKKKDKKINKALKKIEQLPKKKFSQKIINLNKIIPAIQKKESLLEIIKVQKEIKPKIKQSSTVITLSQPKIAKPQKLQQKNKPAPILPVKQQQRQNKTVPTKIQPEQKKNHSNLLDTAGYLKFRQQKLLQDVKGIRELNQARLELVIGQRPHNSLRQYQDFSISLMKPTQFKYSRKNIFENQSLDSNTNHNHNKGKMKEKIYIIKENKIINSFTRINDQQIKQKLEREIQNRTNKLQKCQKILTNISTYQKVDSNININIKPQKQSFNKKQYQLPHRRKSHGISQKAYLDCPDFKNYSFVQQSDITRTKTYLKPLGKQSNQNQDNNKINILPSRNSEKIQRPKVFNL